MKGLNALERINHLVLCVSDQKQFEYDLSTIEKELKDYYALKKECEESRWYQEHKALEIIKKKAVDIVDILCCTYSKCNYRRSQQGLSLLTKKEYDLLKEVLK